MTVDQTARMLVGTTLGFHIILSVAGMGLPLFLAIAEYRGIRYHDENYMELARRGSRAFLVIFAFGAVTGTLVAAELAVVWAPFMAFAGQVIILPFVIEGFAFVLEGMFLGMYLYGWRHFTNPWWHWWTGIPIVIASAASGLLITVVNAWMNTPAGFRLVDGKIRDVHPWQAFFNPSMWVENAHVLTMAYTTVAFILLSIAAYRLLGEPDHPYYLKAARLAATTGTIMLGLTILSGDLSGKLLAVTQPEKLAAAEALFHTQAYAPWVVFGWVDMHARATLGALKIPGLLSFLAYDNLAHPVRGLLSFPVSTWPPVPLVHLFFDVMVSVGSTLFGMGLLYLFFLWRYGAVARWLQKTAVLSGPAVVVTMEAGWLTDEFGRQPWVVYDIMRVSAGITQSAQVDALGFAIMGLLALLALSVPFVLARMFRRLPRYTTDSTSELAAPDQGASR